MTQMYSLSLGYPRGTHSAHVIGCCQISLGSVQRGSRSKNNFRHITCGKGHVWSRSCLPPLFYLDITKTRENVSKGFEITNNNLSGYTSLPLISAVGDVATCITDSLNAFKRMDLSITDSEFETTWIKINNLKAKSSFCCCARGSPHIILEDSKGILSVHYPN